MDSKNRITMADLKKNLSLHLKRKGWTASQLSRASNVAKQKISNMLLGATIRNFDDLKSVATALDLASIDELIFGNSNNVKNFPINGGLLDQEETFEIKIKRVKK